MVSLDGDALAFAQACEAKLGHCSAMVRWSIKKAMFPSRMRRFCTEELKVKPIALHFRPAAVASPWWAVNAVGIRAGESFARSQLPEWEVSNLDAPAWTWRPLREWTEADVIDMHKRHGLKPNPLYIRGASRVGCWPCIFARKTEVAMIDSMTPERVEVIADLEKWLTARSVEKVTARADVPIATDLDPELVEIEEQRRDPKHWRNQRTFFGAGDKGRGWEDYSIRRTVEWAKTDRGGLQMPLFDPLDTAAQDGCMRWGLCETSDAAT